ncbi:MAG: hypothetical protein J3K34DRAFT_406263 [Monoraphidium minutum]|nr:MAG: hypothetical protein J3K34DRAFT_406263 [Monoraphidium minutum]
MYSDAQLAAMGEDELRALADELRRRADQHTRSSQVFMASAADLARRGDERQMASKVAASRDEKSEARRLMDEVHRIMFRVSNLDKTNEWRIDLHGLSRAAAVRKVAAVLGGLAVCTGSGGTVAKIITGQGKHSKDGVAVVRAEVLQYLAEAGYDFRVDPTNEGVVLVFLREAGDGGGEGGRPSGSGGGGGGYAS